jgi:sugar/nucleoside kinase (ribokinase family)
MITVGWPRRLSSGPVVTLGKLVADVVLVLTAELVRGGQVRVRRTISAGGAPANAAAGLARLGVPVRMAGWAGADPLGDGLLTGLAGRGVELAVVRRGSAPVGTVLVHPDGERTLLADAGEGGLEPADLDPAWFAGAAVVHLDGYDLLPGRWPDVVVAAAGQARAAGAAVSVDVAAANRIADVGPDAYADLLRRVRPDLLLCNAREAEVLGDVAALAGLVVVHAGEQPTRVLTGGAELRVPVPPLPDGVVDTTGAGDAFAAGLLAGWWRGLPVPEAVEAGHAAAAVVVSVPGGQAPPLSS